MNPELLVVEHSLMQEISRTCNAMLSVDVLSGLYLLGKQREHGLAVEVGTGHGAGTIALTLGAMQKNPSFRCITFDKIIGGSRARYGGWQENVDMIRSNLERFGVHENVEPIFGDVKDEASRVQEDIDILVLDSDGRIDRDFLLFYSAIKPGGAIVIDDSVGSFRVGTKKTKIFRVESKSTVEGKRGITALLCRHFVDAGLMEEVSRRGPTRFFTKPENAPDRVDPMIVIDAYRAVIPAPVVFGRNQKVMYLPPVVRLCKDLVKWMIRR